MLTSIAVTSRYCTSFSDKLCGPTINPLIYKEKGLYTKRTVLTLETQNQVFKKIFAQALALPRSTNVRNTTQNLPRRTCRDRGRRSFHLGSTFPSKKLVYASGASVQMLKRPAANTFTAALHNSWRGAERTLREFNLLCSSNDAVILRFMASWGTVPNTARVKMLHVSSSWSRWNAACSLLFFYGGLGR